MLPFRGLLVCLSVMFAHSAQTAEDIDTIPFTTTVPCLSQIALEFGYIGVNPLLPQILPQINPPPVDGDMWSQWSQWRAETTMLFRMVPSVTTMRPSLRRNVGPSVPQDQHHDACCHLANMNRRYRRTVPYAIRRRVDRCRPLSKYYGPC